MCLAIENPASCELHAVIHFLHAKNMSAAEINRELCPVVYGQNVLDEGTQDIRAECSKMGEQMITMKSEVVGHPSVVSDDLVQSAD
jgi:hypothetical protein